MLILNQVGDCIISTDSYKSIEVKGGNKIFAIDEIISDNEFQGVMLGEYPDECHAQAIIYEIFFSANYGFYHMPTYDYDQKKRR